MDALFLSATLPGERKWYQTSQNKTGAKISSQEKPRFKILFRFIFQAKLHLEWIRETALPLVRRYHCCCDNHERGVEDEWCFRGIIINLTKAGHKLRDMLLCLAPEHTEAVEEEGEKEMCCSALKESTKQATKTLVMKDWYWQLKRGSQNCCCLVVLFLVVVEFHIYVENELSRSYTVYLNKKN